jgi:NADH:ubiquinone reductase (non-electrogenic)
MRVHGTTNVFAIGDCTMLTDQPALPATAQVASQQGVYLGRLFSRGYEMDTPMPLPLMKHRPRLPVTTSSSTTSADTDSSISSESMAASTAMASTLIGESVSTTSSSAPSGTRDMNEVSFLSEKVAFGRVGRPLPSSSFSSSSLASIDPNQTKTYFAKPFQFLNLGVLAYLGASQALAQIQVNDQTIKSSGQIGFFLWRGVYWFKQVSWKNRFAVTMDWVRTRLFGREMGSM